MIWNLEPQQMLYVTAVVSVYGAILSTFNLLREQFKDRIRLEIVASNGTVKGLFSENENAVSIDIVNNSTFEIEISYLGFTLDSGYNFEVMHRTFLTFGLQGTISSKKSKTYKIDNEEIKKKLIDFNITGEIRMKPCVKVNNKSFYGSYFYFNNLVWNQLIV